MIKEAAGAAAVAAETSCVRRLRDRDEVAALLMPHRLYAAYALAQLEAGRFEQSEWWLAEGSVGKAMAMHSRGWPGNALLTLGDASHLEALLRLHPGPLQTFATFDVGHLDVMRRSYHLAHERPMLRMAVTREDFRGVENPPQAGDGFDLRCLSEDEAGQIDLLYGSEPGNRYLRLGRLEGVYFGLFEGERLAAVAGTTAVAEEAAIAVVGNVFTDPRYRNLGFASYLTGTVTEELLDKCADIVLTVEPENEAAVKAYRRLGYEEKGRLIEGGALRRDALGVGGFVRRLLARLRARSRQQELVSIRLRSEENTASEEKRTGNE